ncbi:MAG: GGDEF domain-containing protein [Spirochaetaceae bacterium]|nr:MAG: GGDEF domain-containing protein [Spirochaetaceae bacterium]
MVARDARWGVLLLLASIGLLGASAWLLVLLGPLPSGRLVGVILPAASVALGVLALFAGHFSYPRVQNLRAYLSGYSVGVQCIVLALFVGFAGFYTDAIPTAPTGFSELVIAAGLAGSLTYSVVRPFPTYRTTRTVTLIVIVAQVVALTAIRLFPATFDWFGVLRVVELVTPVAAVALGLGLVVVVVNIIMKPESFYLRGVFSGLALLAAGFWVMGPAIDAAGYGPVSRDLSIMLYASVAPLFLLIGILYHVLARMDHRASYDPLLQIYNRRYCDQILAEQSSVNTRPPITVVMIDIDHFKKVNDTYGHQAGDQVLFAIAQAVQKAVVPDGVVCRYGGEELIAFFPGLGGRDVVPRAKRLRETIERMEIAHRKHRINVTISIGMSDRKSGRHSLSQVVYAADQALYRAKEEGRNQIRFMRIRS